MRCLQPLVHGYFIGSMLLVCSSLAQPTDISAGSKDLDLEKPGRMGMSASPHDIQEFQPDGTPIVLNIRGGVNFHWLEDPAGYTVVQSGKAFVYAQLDANGRLAPTALLVGLADPVASGLKPRTLPSLEVRDQMEAERLTRAPITSRSPAIAAAGTIKNVVILLRFSNHTTRVLPTDATISTIFNAEGGDPTDAPTGSVRDLYLENSYGAMTLNSTVYGWVTLPKTEAYYANGVSGDETVWEAITSALNLTDALIDYNQFDGDSDGWVDSIAFIHSGYGAEWGGTDSSGVYYTSRIWSHRWSIPTWTSAEGVRVSDYHISPALWGISGSAPGRIGVICHETGHFFGLPDLYDTDSSSAGIGSYCMMANSWGFDGQQLHPPHFSAWSKIFLGWVTPTPLNLPGNYSLPQVETNPSIYKITNGYPSGEYLLVENRQPYGFESIMPQGGLAIWHIDEAKANNNSEGYPGQTGWPGNNRHYKIALLQADGLYNLERSPSARGDAGDVYHGGGVTQISHSTTPNTDAYKSGLVINTGNRIHSIGPAGTPMTFSYAIDPPLVTVVATDSSAAEPSATGTFTFTRSGSTTAALTANISVTGTATSGSDYATIGTTVVFAAGSATAIKTVTPIDDQTAESSETVIATVSAGTGYAVGSPASATIVIADDDSGLVEDLLVDNGDGPAKVLVAGVWTPSTGAPGYWDADYLHDGNAGKGSKSVTFIPTVVAAGAYQVGFWYAAHPGRASNVPVDVIHAGGTTTVLVNERINGSQWLSLGTFNFAAGTAGRVVVRTTATDGYVIADAIQLTPLPVVTVAATDAAASEPSDPGTLTFTRTGPTEAALTANISVTGTATSGTDYTALGTTVVFEAGAATATKAVTPLDDAAVESPETVIATVVSGSGYVVGTPASATVTISDDDGVVEDLLVDNLDGPAQVQVVGAWTPSTGAPGYWGLDYLHDGNAGKGSKSVTLIPTVGTAGTYEVGLWYAAHPGRASNVPVDVVHAGGTTTVLVNQRVNGSQWFSLGTFNFAVGTAGRVVVRTTATDGYVIADAIQLTPLPVVTVTATDGAASEPSDAGTLTFTRTGPTGASLTANISVSGTATSGTDYSTLGTTVVFAAGAATATKTVTPLDDAAVEGPETVIATVVSGSGYVVGTPASATVTISDNDVVLEDLLVDNLDGPTQVQVAGAWTLSTGAPGYWSADYLHDGNAGKGSKSVTFIPTVGTAGAYQVELWYAAHPGRATSVPVDVVHAAGTTTVLVNERINGSQWFSLGSFNFAVGTAGRVVVRTTGTTDGYVVADAIQLTPAAPLPVLTGDSLMNVRVNLTERGTRWDTTGARLRLPRQPGQRYSVESSTDLIHWTPIRNWVVSEEEIDVGVTGEGSQQFYRLSPVSAEP